MATVKFALTPYDLQKEIISFLDGEQVNIFGEAYRFIVVAIGRQAGKSWLAKYTLLDRAINRKQRCVWVAPTIPTARAHWDDLVKMVESSGLPVKKISQAAKQIIFMDGGEISVRSAVEPDNMRGLTVDYVVMDEAAFFRNGEYVWYSIVLPMVTASRGVVMFTSTPNGRNYFWQLFTQGIDPTNRLYKSFHAPSTISPYQDPVLLAELQTTMPEFQWREEFLAEFLTDGSGVFARSTEAATKEPLEAPLDMHAYVAGIDFGFNHDATTFTVIDKYTREQVFGKRFFNYGTAGTLRQLALLINLWRPTITHLEKNGVGESLFQILRAVLNGDEAEIPDILNARDVAPDDKESDYGQIDDFPEQTERSFETVWHGRLKAIHMDNATKRKLVEMLAADIEYGRLKTLKPDPGTYGEVQLNEMSTYQRERTKNSLDVTYNAAEGSYDDTVSGLYLANKGMPRPRPFFGKKDEDQPRRNPFKSARTRAILLGRRIDAQRN